MNRRIDRRSFVACPFNGVSHRPLLDLIGESWLHKELKTLSSALAEKTKRYPFSSKHFRRFLQTNDHVLIREVARPTQEDDQFPGWKPFWDATSAAVEHVEGLDGFARKSMQARLRDVQSSRAAAFELLIAAGYCRSSWDVKWTDAGESRAGEFRAQHGDEVVFVECKAKDEFTERMNQLRLLQRQVSDRLIHRLESTS